MLGHTVSLYRESPTTRRRYHRDLGVAIAQKGHLRLSGATLPGRHRAPNPARLKQAAALALALRSDGAHAGALSPGAWRESRGCNWSAKSVQANPGKSKQNQSKTKHKCLFCLVESGLFKGLRGEKTKKFPAPPTRAVGCGLERSFFKQPQSSRPVMGRAPDGFRHQEHIA
jgi:hypothetical protein